MTAIGESVVRLEDRRLLVGQGEFVDDLAVPGLLHAQVVRSPHAHAKLLGIDPQAARAMPGVRLVLLASDLDGIGSIGLDFRPPGPAGVDPSWPAPLQPALARDVVRYVGEPVAFVVADTVQQARDAAEAVVVDYDPLPAIAATTEAAGSTTVLWPQFPDNVGFRHELGDAQATARAFASGHRVVRFEIVQNRVIANPIEPRCALALPASGHAPLTLYVGTQRPHGLRQMLADEVLRMPADDLRVFTRDVGGGFGAKNSLYPEHILCLVAARALVRPVKWLATRSEGMISDQHARDNAFEAELALSDAGDFLGLRVLRRVNLGAYVSPRTFVPTYNGLALLAGFYRIGAAHVRVEGVFSNTLPTTVYRGAGRPEVVHVCERLVDAGARELRMDPIALRRRNAIGRDALPYANPLGAHFPDADFRTPLEQALAAIGYDTLNARRAAAREAGRLHGLGVAWFVENLHGPARTRPAWLRASADGEGFEVVVGTVSNGQGHETTFPQVVAARLGVPLESLRFVQGDTATVPEAIGTGASWSLTLMGSSLVLAADEAMRQGREVAAELLEVSAGDVEYADGAFRVVGTDRAAAWRDVFAARPGFTAVGHFEDYDEGFPVACHACEVEIDPDTGTVAVRRYVVAQDAGRIVNPLIAAGQLHGGVAHGLGQALMEEARYDRETAQLLSGSFMDYAMPRAEDLPALECEFVDGPAGDNPLGVKGLGEAGTTGAAPCVVNAVLDALAPLGVRHLDMPLTPLKVWEAIRASGGR